MPPARETAQPQYTGTGGILERTFSEKEKYDADAGGIDGHFGSYGHANHTLQPRRTRTRENDVSLAKREARELDEVRHGGTGAIAQAAPSADQDLEQGSTLNNSESDSDSSPPPPESKQKDKDPNLVTWDSPDSLENPRNWSYRRRWLVVLTVSSYTFLSPLSSSMIAPALPIISDQFGVTSSVRQNLMLSTFVLAYAFGPLFLAPMSEMFGRRIVLQLSNLLYVLLSIVLLSQVVAQAD